MTVGGQSAVKSVLLEMITEGSLHQKCESKQRSNTDVCQRLQKYREDLFIRHCFRLKQIKKEEERECFVTKEAGEVMVDGH